MADTPESIQLELQPVQPPRRRKQNRQRIVMVATVILVVAAWIYGYISSGTDVAPLVPEVIPDATRVEVSGSLFIGYSDESDEPVGYAAVGEAPGYAGPIEMLVGIYPDGEISGVSIVAQRESPGFFRLIENQEFVLQFFGKAVSDPLQLGQDIDAVSGATTSAEAIARSVRLAARQVSAQALNQPLPAETRPIQIGIPEITIVLLYGVGYVGHRLRNRQWQKRIRWLTLLTGMVVLGFIYTLPFTITMVVSLLSGFWPDWQSNLYWYLMIGGIIFVTTVDAKNPYCSWFCPFGAFQESLAKISGAKVYRPRDLNEFFTWLQRGLAFVAVLIGLLLRRPGVASYEPFATLFDLRGTGIEWIFLGIIVIASLLMYRPFCNFLCPLDPIYEFIAAARKWVREVWRRWQKQSAKA
ncbi:MAG: FMN-binding protein [Chloroflexi bacterium]|nr:MAG: FMN-binding protein [Chloroflexota bacterium]MBL1195447.1 FMN-binding protein [Chloroflexota bacterium]NOH12730.1 FMN-binding protein [Chloroflexota bacterium]